MRAGDLLLPLPNFLSLYVFRRNELKLQNFLSEPGDFSMRGTNFICSIEMEREVYSQEVRSVSCGTVVT